MLLGPSLENKTCYSTDIEIRRNNDRIGVGGKDTEPSANIMINEKIQGTIDICNKGK